MKLLFATLVVGTFMISPTVVLGQSSNLEQARKEGEVVLYSTITVSAFNELNTAIKEKYPFLNVRHIRLGPAQQLARIMQEQRSGHFLVDVIYNNLLHLIYLKQNGSLGKYESAENKFLMKEAIDPDGFWVGGDIDVLVTGFNSRMISRPNVPTTYDGFLDGRLKGQMAINTNNPYALVGMVSLRGEEQGVAYIRKLAQQSLRPVQGFTHMVNLLAGRRTHAELLKLRFGVVDAFHPEPQVMETFFHPAIGIVVARHDGQVGHPIGQIKIFRI